MWCLYGSTLPFPFLSSATLEIFCWGDGFVEMVAGRGRPCRDTRASSVRTYFTPPHPPPAHSDGCKGLVCAITSSLLSVPPGIRTPGNAGSGRSFTTDNLQSNPSLTHQC
ncbi:hypothetical protein LZ30DRAFT_383151 [Colletotrichum cereale]|nr:hypothetical protein LZ30DRAFT_383151 [Colletotrichum cereale]